MVQVIDCMVLDLMNQMPKIVTLNNYSKNLENKNIYLINK